MMNSFFKSFFGVQILIVLLCSGCIKDEAPNREVDVLAVVPMNEDGVLDIVYQNQGATIYVDESRVDLNNFPLFLTLAEGATIVPDPATVHDYKTPQTFVITSEDGQTSKQYQVQLHADELPSVFSFDDWYSPEGTRYQLPCVNVGDKAAPRMLNVWACGNEAYVFVVGRKGDYTKYPTQPTTETCDGKGLAAKMITCSTPDPTRSMASGSLFLGDFDASDYEPLNGTHFGLSYRKVPQELKGYYKYKPEKSFDGTVDECRIMAVFFRADNNVQHLDGFSIKNSPNIVARAELQDAGETEGDGYHPFCLKFNYVDEVNLQELAKGNYKIAVNFASSRDGDVYSGAIGSTLWIDNVEIVNR